MTFTKLLLMLLLSFCLMYPCCINGRIEWNDRICNNLGYDECQRLSIPFVKSKDYSRYCAAACVVMWCLYDGMIETAPTQEQVMEFMGGGGLVNNAIQVRDAVNYFTYSRAYFEYAAPYDMEVARGILSGAKSSVDCKLPSIFVINHGWHAIILCGYCYNFVDSTIQGHVFKFRDPNRPETEWYADEYGYSDFIDLYWTPSHLGTRDCVRGWHRFGITADVDPMTELKNFYRYNGTYYGGPDPYIPSGSKFVRISFPIGMNKLCQGEQRTIKWESNGLTGNIKLELLKGDAHCGTIATNLPISQSSYSWNVGQYQGGTATVGDDYKIKITMMDGSDYDTSNVDFSITPRLPDVVITGITLSPAAPTPGTPVTIKATIKNQGTAATPSGVDVGTGFSVDNVYLGAFFVKDANGNKTNLAYGSSYTGICNTVWTATAGTHKIKAKADDVNRFAEADENNNSLEKSFTIANVLPDVIIQDIWLEPLSSGTNYKIHARIKNKGTAATPVGVDVSVSFRVDGTYLGAFFVKNSNGVKTNLAAGASFNGVCATQWVKVKGTHSFWAKADAQHRFPESNENNNERTESITVQ